jgi:hypothetical protein
MDGNGKCKVIEHRLSFMILFIIYLLSNPPSTGLSRIQTFKHKMKFVFTNIRRCVHTAVFIETLMLTFHLLRANLGNIPEDLINGNVKLQKRRRLHGQCKQNKNKRAMMALRSLTCI